MVRHASFGADKEKSSGVRRGSDGGAGMSSGFLKKIRGKKEDLKEVAKATGGLLTGRSGRKD